LKGAERIDSTDLWPCLFDKASDHPVDWQYFYQDSWAARRILQTRPVEHVDVGSRVDFAGILSASIPVTFIDIRPLKVRLANLRTAGGSILQLPLSDASVRSLSCLHVIEHVGLGRYGDPMDPSGSRKAGAELARVLAPGGNLFLGVPVGRERVCFNAHRVHAPKTILDYFKGLDLIEFSCVVGDGCYLERADPLSTDLGYAACGLFWFAKQC
jgi:SAM-dependent methyltransferase